MPDDIEVETGTTEITPPAPVPVSLPYPDGPQDDEADGAWGPV